LYNRLAGWLVPLRPPTNQRHSEDAMAKTIDGIRIPDDGRRAVVGGLSGPTARREATFLHHP
jgi:hypothetical protein